jgi:hypothetical protein
MRFEDILFRWVLLSLIFATLLGGIPWKFPAHGRYWIKNLENSSK